MKMTAKAINNKLGVSVRIIREISVFGSTNHKIKCSPFIVLIQQYILQAWKAKL